MSGHESTTQMAVVHRPTDCGIDLPPGVSEKELRTSDYHPVEMMDETIEPAIVHRPNDCGVDLPPGASAKDLSPTDYRIIEIDPDD